MLTSNTATFTRDFDIFLYACETCTITKKPQRRISAIEYRCLNNILKITYKDRLTDIEVSNRILRTIGPHKDLLMKSKERKLLWYGHVSRNNNSISKVIFKGAVNCTIRS